MPTRDPALLAECRALRAAVTGHATLAALESALEWPALRTRFTGLLGTIRRHVPDAPPAAPAALSLPGALRIVQWNIEHGNAYEAIEAALLGHPDLAGADLITLEEVDLGCARSGNRDVAGELARRLGLQAVWAPLFLETTSGRHDDLRRAAGRANDEGLFGIAILSRWALGDVHLLELPSPRELQFGRERMVGRHVALIAEVLRPDGAFVAVATHLEVHRTREHRAEQVRQIVAALATETRPVVLAGDFNSHTFDRGLWHAPVQGTLALTLTPTPLLRARLNHPDRGPFHETLFDVLRHAGFEWTRAADFAPTLRLQDERLEEMRALPWLLRAPAARVLRWAVHRGAMRLDWICGRGWADATGGTVAGLDGPGGASDHAPVVATLC